MEKNYLMDDLIFLIPARSGSKRLKNKNLRSLRKKTILSDKIRNCLKTNLGKVIVSTDCKKISKASINAGAEVPFLRDKSISNSKSTMVSVILHYLNFCKKNKLHIPKYLALVPVTNPFLKSKSIIKAFNKLKKNKKYNSIISVFKTTEDPLSLVKINDNRIDFKTLNYNKLNYFSFERSQDKPRFMKISSSIQITKTKFFFKFLNKNIKKIKVKPFDVNSCCSFIINQFESYDINSKNDFNLAKRFLKKQKLLRLFAENFF